MSADVKSPEFTFTATMPESQAEGWYVTELGDSPTPAETMRAAATIARKMESGKITIAAQGQTVTIDGLSTTWDGDPKTGAGTCRQQDHQHRHPREPHRHARPGRHAEAAGLHQP